MTFGEIIKILRESKGMSSYQLSDASGIKYDWISKYERNVCNPIDHGFYDKLTKLADTLEVDISVLKGCCESPKENLPKIRESLGMSREDFAKAVNCTPRAITDYETGKKQLKTMMVTRICNKTGVPFRKFYENDITEEQLLSYREEPEETTPEETTIEEPHFTTVRAWHDNTFVHEKKYSVIYANDTKVMYALMEGPSFANMVPLYNPDGTLQTYKDDDIENDIEEKEEQQ